MKKILALICVCSAFAAFGCDDDDNKKTGDFGNVCKPGCSGNSLTTCEGGVLKVEDCGSAGCNSKTNTCNDSSVTVVPECSAGDKKCDGNGLYACDASSHWTLSQSCANGCNASTKTCNASSSVEPSKECTAGAKKCDGNGLYACDATSHWALSETCPNGCDASTNTCKASSGGTTTPTCANGAGTQAAGSTSNGWTYTGCACDSSYPKKCGSVNGKEVVYACYNNNEEYKACDSCSIGGDGKYTCGGSSSGGGSTTSPSVGQKCNYDTASDVCSGTQLFYCDPSTNTYQMDNCADKEMLCVVVKDGYDEGVNLASCVDEENDACTSEEEEFGDYIAWCDEYEDGVYTDYYVCTKTTNGKYYYIYADYDECLDGCDEYGEECE